MKQKLLKTMLLLCALIVGGASSVWADSYTITFATGTGDGTSASTSTACSTVVSAGGAYLSGNLATATKVYYGGSDGLKLGASSDAGVIKMNLASNITPTSIVVNAKRYNSSKAVTLSVNGSTAQSINTDFSNLTFNITSEISYIQLNSSKYCWIKSITVNYAAASSGEETTTTIDASGITNTNKFVSTSAGSLSASVTYGDPAAAVPAASVTWSGDNDAVATINASTGAVTLVGAGTVTFTAEYEGVADTYQPSSDTYEMTVTNEDPSIVTIWSEDFSTYDADNVPNGDPYSYKCTDGGGTSKIYTQNTAGGTSPELLIGKTNGTFSATIPLLHSTYGYSGDLTLTFKSNTTINVKTTTDGLTVDGEENEGEGVSFSTKDTHTVTFKGVTTITENITIVFTATSGSNVRLDDIVLRGKQAELTIVATPSISPASGALVAGTEVTMTCATAGATIYYTTDGSTPTSSSTAYNPESKPTITSGCTIKAIGIKDGLTDSDVASATYTIAEPCATPAFSVAEGEVAKGTTVTISCDTDGATIYYTTNGSTPTTSSNVYSSAITINTNQTIKAIAVKDGNANSEVASATYTIIDYATLPFDYDGNGTGTLPTGLTVSGTSTYASSPKIQFNGTGDYVILKTGQALGFVSFDVKGNSFSGGTFTVQTSADGESYTNLASYTSLNSTTETKSYYNLSSDIRYIKWIYTTKSNGNVALGKINVGKPVKFNSEGYATFASASDLDFTGKDYTAWIVTAISGDVITFSKVTEAPASTGLLLMGTAGNTANITTTSDVAALSETNLLTGITSATAVAVDKYYGLSGNKFVKVNAGTVPAGKALLPASEVSEEIKSFTFIFNDSETGITETRTVSREVVETIFDLNGRRLSQPQKGINIVNGRKVVVK